METTLLLLLLAPSCCLLGGGLSIPEGLRQDHPATASCSVSRRNTTIGAVNELFSCLLTTHVEPTEIFRRARGIDFHGIAGNGVTREPLLKGLYSVSDLKQTGAESYRRYFDVASVFNVELGREEVRGPVELAKLDAYFIFLERSPFVRDTFETLKANLAIEENTTLSQFVRGTMYDIWFKQYARTAKAHERGLRESSGFGHVFVGEVKTNEVTGFHSWLQLLASEEAGTFEYKGYVKVINGSLLIGGIQFNWLGRPKPLSSLMFAVPPEFELALYTACFIMAPGRKCGLSIKKKPVAVQTFYVNHQNESVATAYPIT